MGVPPSLVLRAVLSGIAGGLPAFIAGVALLGWLLSESDAQSWGEVVLYALTTGLGGTASLALARRRGESPSRQAVAFGLGAVAIAALLVLLFVAYWHVLLDGGVVGDDFD